MRIISATSRAKRPHTHRLWMLNKSNKLINALLCELENQRCRFHFSLTPPSTLSPPSRFSPDSQQQTLFSYHLFLSYSNTIHTLRAAFPPPESANWSKCNAFRKKRMKTRFAAALGGSLTKLGVNGGLVASAGLFSSSSSSGTGPGPSHRNRP